MLLDLNPPTTLESMSLPLASVRLWLSGAAKDDSGLVDVEGASESESKEGSSSPRWVLKRDESESRWRRAFIRDIEPGDTIVVPVTFGGCDEFGFAPSSASSVVDLSALARQMLRKSAQIVVTPQWIEMLGIDADVVRQIWRNVSECWKQEAELGTALEELVGTAGELLPADQRWIGAQPVIDTVENPDGSLFAVVLTENGVLIGDISDEDVSSSRTIPVALHEHNAGVAKNAKSLAQLLSLEPHHIDHVALAGQLHDIGKADPRFQQMLRFGDNDTLQGVLLAKGLRGSRLVRKESVERHEAYSVALIDKYPGLLREVKDKALVRYLIGVHHGRGRALMPDRNDEGTAFGIEIAGNNYEFDGSASLGGLQAGWASLFWQLNERYGPWGLAFLESVLRLADWLQSAEELKKEPK